MCFSQTLSTKTGGLDSAHRLWFTDPWSNVINTWEQLKKKKKKVGVLFPITFKRALFFITKIGRRVGFFFLVFFLSLETSRRQRKKKRREKKSKNKRIGFDFKKGNGELKWGELFVRPLGAAACPAHLFRSPSLLRGRQRRKEKAVDGQGLQNVQTISVPRKRPF